MMVNATGNPKRFSICDSLSRERKDYLLKMQVHRFLPEKRILDNCALTIGTFDGVHRGHQLLIEKLKAEADKRGLQSAALTFDDMPICLLRPDVCPLLLTLRDEKIEAFAKTPLDHLFIVPFTHEIASQGARQWMQKWVDNIGLKLFVGGPDFALGRNREGTIPRLKEIGADLGFEAMSLEGKLTESFEPISSTRSRIAIQNGDVERAPALLGHFYRVIGRVVAGQQLGRTLGFPTINITAESRKCLPRDGVYAIRAFWGDQSYPAALNSGFRPTVNGIQHQIEFHVVDREIFGAPSHVEIEFVSRLRGETKFDGLESLQRQLKIDVRQVREILS